MHQSQPPSPAAAVPWIAIKTSLFVSDCNWTHVHWLSKSNCTSTCQKMEACPILGGIIDIKCLEQDKSDSCHSVPFIHPVGFRPQWIFQKWQNQTSLASFGNTRQAEAGSISAELNAKDIVSGTLSPAYPGACSRAWVQACLAGKVTYSQLHWYQLHRMV